MSEPVWAILGKNYPIHCWSMENTIFFQNMPSRKNHCVTPVSYTLLIVISFYKIARIYNISSLLYEVVSILRFAVTMTLMAEIWAKMSFF